MASFYIVKAGDDLMRIAAAFYGDFTLWRDIAEANDMRGPYELQVGQKIRLP